MPAACLELDERGFVRVKVAAGQGVNLLPDHADGGIAHVVVHVFQPGVDHGFALVFGNDELIAVHPEDL